jgi:hypothetical protein
MQKKKSYRQYSLKNGRMFLNLSSVILSISRILKPKFKCISSSYVLRAKNFIRIKK